jgi:hypothetical protein
MRMRYRGTDSLLFRILAGCVPFLLGVYLAVNPFPHKTAIENISFYASFGFFLILLGTRKMTLRFRNPLTLPFALFAVWSLSGLFFALDRSNGGHDFYAHFIQYVILLYLLVHFYPSERRLTLLIGIMIVSSTVFALWVMITFYGVQGFPLNTKLGVQSIDELSSNIIGTLTLFPAILSLGWLTREKESYRRIAALACLAILGVATLATMARSALVAMIVAVLIMMPLLFRNKRFFILFSLFLLAAVIVMPVRDRFTPTNLIEKLKITDRLNIALTYVEIVKDNPIMGIGFGMEAYGDEALLNKYNARLPAQYRQPVPAKAPHNSLIDVAVRTGLVGLGLFIYIVFSLVKMAMVMARQGSSAFVREWALCLLAAFAALFVQSLFENTLSGPPAIALYAVMGMVVILWHLEQDQNFLKEANQA